jgi:hypothetical protein
MAGVPLMRRRRPGCSSSPPKWFFGLESDVAPGKSDIVQVPVAQLRQQVPLALTLPPDVNGFAELCQKAGTMMIYHRFMCKNGHLHLLKLKSVAVNIGLIQPFGKRHFVPLRMK